MNEPVVSVMSVFLKIEDLLTKADQEKNMAVIYLEKFKTYSFDENISLVERSTLHLQQCKTNLSCFEKVKLIKDVSKKSGSCISIYATQQKYTSAHTEI